MGQSDRTQALIGYEGLHKLRSARVAVFGAGGVGAAAIEALARAEIGSIDIIDKDTVDETNINRQLIAFHSTVGRPKVQVVAERINDINPNCTVNAYEMFFLPETAGQIDFSKFDYVIDAVDTVTAKLEIVSICKEYGIPVISCMGTGNKIYPEMFEIDDIFRTSSDPLAKVMRKELRTRGIEELKVVYSKEKPVKTGIRTPASISYTPPVAGYIMAGEAIRYIAGLE